MPQRVIVAGGGAAGLLSAIYARKSGADVTVIEKNTIIGRKINATGNGRCNLTNADAENTEHYSGSNKSFISGIIGQFGVSDILSFFSEIGIEAVQEDNGKYFPVCSQATAVSELLERKAREIGIKIILGECIKSIETKKKDISVNTESGAYSADKLIITTGGKAAPDTGSDGFGFDFAEKLGHRVKPILPAIVQLKTHGGFYKRIDGLRVKADVTLEIQGKNEGTVFGDLMFFDYGLSGPPIFTLSNKASVALAKGEKVFCKINLLPIESFGDKFSETRLSETLYERAERLSCTAEELLVGIIHKKLIKQVLETASLKPEAKHLTEKELCSLAEALCSWRVEIIGTKGFENAQSTLGGISTDEVDSISLRSEIDRRIAFAGEILDVCGECGGYNLTWAWSSGFAAGSHINE